MKEAMRYNIEQTKIIVSDPVVNTYGESKAVKKIFEEIYYFKIRS